MPWAVGSGGLVPVAAAGGAGTGLGCGLGLGLAGGVGLAVGLGSGSGGGLPIDLPGAVDQAAEHHFRFAAIVHQDHQGILVQVQALQVAGVEGGVEAGLAPAVGGKRAQLIGGEALGALGQQQGVEPAPGGALHGEAHGTLQGAPLQAHMAAHAPPQRAQQDQRAAKIVSLHRQIPSRPLSL